MKSNEITKVRGSKMIQDMYNEYIEVTPSVFSYRVLSDKSNKGGDVSRVKFQKINCDDDQLICRRTLNGSTGRKTGFIKLSFIFQPVKSNMKFIGNALNLATMLILKIIKTF